MRIAKLDKLIIKTFIGPFIATFFITLFAIVIQHFWKYIDEMVGKGIDALTLLQMVGVVSLSVGVMFALPISVLLASLMTFGNLGESFELVAIKSSGISLMRFMRPLFYFVLLVCGVAFLFNNYVLPRANLKFFTMLSDIRLSKPAFDLRPGEFYTALGNYAIQVQSKDDKRGTLKGIVIYENANSSYQDNFMIADSGRMNISANKSQLDFILYNGERVQERGVAGSSDQKTDFIRTQFAQYKKTFDISSLMMKKTADSVNKDFYKALNISQLNSNIDSLEKQTNNFAKKISPSIQQNLLFLTYLNDTAWAKLKPAKPLPNGIKKYTDLLPDSAKQNISSTLATKFDAAKNQIDADMYNYNSKQETLRYHNMEWHRKFTFSIICLVMFLIGAPLGAIIRRGGLGVPLLVAILFFVLYFVCSSIGEKSANAETLTPLIGLWLPVLVLTPVGLYLMYQARKDSALFNLEYYTTLVNNIKTYLLVKLKKNTDPSIKQG